MPDENGQISSNGLYYTDENGQITLKSVVGTLVVTEVETIDGYTISDANRTRTIEVKPDDTQTIYIYNDPLCSLTLTKLDSVTGKKNSGKDVDMLCRVYYGLTYEEEAELYYKLDQAKGHLRLAHATKALLESGSNAEITKIKQLLEDSNLLFFNLPRPVRPGA